jgi:hypothetical protein
VPLPGGAPQNTPRPDQEIEQPPRKPLKMKTVKLQIHPVAVVLIFALIIGSVFARLIYIKETIDTNQQLRTELYRVLSRDEKVPSEQLQITEVTGDYANKQFEITVQFRKSDETFHRSAYKAAHPLLGRWSVGQRIETTKPD